MVSLPNATFSFFSLYLYGVAAVDGCGAPGLCG